MPNMQVPQGVSQVPQGVSQVAQGVPQVPQCPPGMQIPHLFASTQQCPPGQKPQGQNFPSQMVRPQTYTGYQGEYNNYQQGQTGQWNRY